MRTAAVMRPTGSMRLSRRQLLSVAGAGLASACFGRGSGSDGPHDVVLISADDLNDWVPPFGGYPGRVHAPNFERLASRGVVFNNTHAQSVSCMTSRASVVTGMYPETTGIRGILAQHDFREFVPDATTIPSHFRDFGYETLGFGKVFHRPDPISWDRLIHDWPNPKPGRPLSGLRLPYYLDWGPIDLPASFMGDHRMVSAALEALRRPREKPLFLGIGTVKPHTPWIVPREFFDLYPLAEVVQPVTPAGDLSDIPVIADAQLASRGYQQIFDSRDLSRSIAQAYLATLSFVDSLLGMVLDELDRTRAWERTIVVLWSDHGIHLGEKERWDKFTLWEESTRVPLIVWAPGVERGTRCNRAVGLIDLFPTLTELCGLPTPEQVEGESLVPLLEEPGSERERPALTSWRDNHAVRSDRWRYIRYVDGSEELYDHDEDPGEQTNLAGDPRFASVKAELAVWLDRRPGAGASG